MYSVSVFCFPRDEQYNLLWNELETIASKYSGLSEQHRILFDIISHAMSQSPSCQNMKSLVDKKEEGSETNKKLVAEDSTTSSNISSSKQTQSLSWTKGLRNAPYPIPGMINCGIVSINLFFAAKPVASLLSIWTTQLNAKATAGHPEFKGRILSQTNKADLYTYMKNGKDRLAQNCYILY